MYNHSRGLSEGACTVVRPIRLHMDAFTPLLAFALEDKLTAFNCALLSDAFLASFEGIPVCALFSMGTRTTLFDMIPCPSHIRGMLIPALQWFDVYDAHSMMLKCTKCCITLEDKICIINTYFTYMHIITGPIMT